MSLPTHRSSMTPTQTATSRRVVCAIGCALATMVACRPLSSKTITTTPAHVDPTQAPEVNARCQEGSIAFTSAVSSLTCSDVHAAVFGPLPRVSTNDPEFDQSTAVADGWDCHFVLDAGFHRLLYVDADAAIEAFDEAVSCARADGDEELASFASGAMEYARSWSSRSEAERFSEARDLLTRIAAERRDELFRRNVLAELVEQLVVDSPDPDRSIAFVRAVVPVPAVRDRILLNASDRLRHTVPRRHAITLLDTLRETDDVGLRCNVLARSLLFAAADFDGETRPLCDLARQTVSAMEASYTQRMTHDSDDTRGWLSRCWTTAYEGFARAIEVVPPPARVATSEQASHCTRIDLREMQIAMFTRGSTRCAGRGSMCDGGGPWVCCLSSMWRCEAIPPTEIVDHALDLARVGRISACESALALAADSGHTLRETDVCGSAPGDGESVR